MHLKFLEKDQDQLVEIAQFMEDCMPERSEEELRKILEEFQALRLECRK